MEKSQVEEKSKEMQKRPAEEQVEKQERKGRKKRKKLDDDGKYSPQQDIVFACKANLPQLAIEAFQRAVREDVKMPLQTCHSVLFLCLGGENWDKYLRARYGQKVQVPYMQFGDRGTDLWKFQWQNQGQQIQNGKTSMSNGVLEADSQNGSQGNGSEKEISQEELIQQYKEANEKGVRFKFPEINKQQGWVSVEAIHSSTLQAAQDVLKYMREQGYTANEMSLTAEARLAALQGNIEEAYKFMERIISEKMHVKIRNFHPALMGFMLEGNVERVLQVAKHINDQGLDLTEAEFGIMAEAITKHGSYSEVTGLLYRLQKELGQLQDYIIEILRDYFSGERSKKAFQQGNLLGGFGYTIWSITQERVKFSGECEVAGGQLQVMDLENQEWADFLAGLEQLACTRIGESQWKKQKQLLDQRNPKILIDGANVALFGHSVSEKFSWRQIKQAVEVVEQKFPGEKPLVFLNVGRVNAPYTVKDKFNKSFCDKLKEEGKLFVTPKGSNDDWYWLYAVAKAAQEGFLISNDELRDHIFQLIRPKYFLKWKDRHQIKYQFEKKEGKMVLEPPPNYTTCVQELPNGVWMFPTTKKNDWMCVKPMVQKNQ